MELPSGELRPLTDEEVQLLHQHMQKGIPKKTTKPAPKRKPGEKATV